MRVGHRCSSAGRSRDPRQDLNPLGDIAGRGGGVKRSRRGGAPGCIGCFWRFFRGREDHDRDHDHDHDPDRDPDPDRDREHYWTESMQWTKSNHVDGSEGP